MLGGMAELLAMDPELLDDLKTAVSEACNNVVLHAYPDGSGPLTVSLNVPNARLGQVKVTLSLPTGSVTYVDEEEGTLATYPVTNWSISFITDLDRNPVDLATLATLPA